MDLTVMPSTDNFSESSLMGCFNYFRIVLVADSLALPRPPEMKEVEYEETYPYVFRQKMSSALDGKVMELVLRARRRNSIRTIDPYDDLLAWKPHIAIIHIGIVDCAPRVFSRIERKVISRIRPISIRDMLVSFVGKHRRFILTHMPEKVYVPICEFEALYKDLCNTLFAHNIKALLVNIAPTDDETSHRSPGLSRNIREYNEVIDNCSGVYENCYLVDLYSKIVQNPKRWLLDGIHLNQDGNRLLADLLMSKVITIIA